MSWWSLYSNRSDDAASATAQTRFGLHIVKVNPSERDRTQVSVLVFTESNSVRIKVLGYLLSQIYGFVDIYFVFKG